MSSDFVLDTTAVVEQDAAAEKPPEVKQEPVKTITVEAIKVEMLQNSVRLELTPGLYKVVSYPEFIGLLNANVEASDTGESQKQEIWLPNGAFYFEKSKNGIRVCCYYPGGIKPIKYLSNSPFNVVFPNVIISQSLVKSGPTEYLVNDTRYYATRDSLQEIPRTFITAENGVSILPFTNVYESGKLCYGSNTKISSYKLPDLRGLHSYYQLLFDAPFNNDLGLTALKPKFRNEEYSKWYSHLKKLADQGGTFPYEELRIY